MRPLGCCVPWSTTPAELVGITRWRNSADGLRGPRWLRTALGFQSLRDQRLHRRLIMADRPCVKDPRAWEAPLDRSIGSDPRARRAWVLRDTLNSDDGDTFA